MAIHPGDILAGYRVVRLLGRGGMGEVWAASSDAGPDGARRDVAIKVLLPRAATKPDIVRRFEREAKIASAIKSPFVCQLLEVAHSDEGAHLLVFEQLTGESLADRLKREQYLPLSEVGPIIEDVLQGLAAAHGAGVIHRDLKPGNIFLEQLPQLAEPAYAPPSGGFGFGAAPPPARRERAKVLDFGISKLTRREQEEPTLTAFDATLGSFAYMAPEQVRGAARADERADIYAVGSVAFRALSGRLPFEGTTAAVLVAMKLDRQAPSLAEATGEQWPAGVERFLERALERRPEARFASADEALEVWRSIQPSALVTPRDAALGAPTPAPPPVPTRLPHGRGRHGTLTMDEAPLPSLLPTDEPRLPSTSNRFVINRVTGKPEPAPPRHAAAKGGAKIPAPTAVRIPAPGAVGRPVAPIPGAPQPPGHGARPAAPPMPAIARPPMQSYQVIDDNPTELDGPPEMTVDPSYSPPPADGAGPARHAPRPAPRRGKSGRS